MSFFWGRKKAAEPVEAPVRSYLPCDEEKERMTEIRSILAEKRDEYVVEGHDEYVFTDIKVLRFLRGNKQVVEKAAGE